MRSIVLAIISNFILFPLFSQTWSFYDENEFNRQDSLRGFITQERAWWDLLRYELEVSVYPKTKSIEGKNIVFFKVLEEYSVMQIDLQKPLEIESVEMANNKLEFSRDGNAYFIQMPKLSVGEEAAITITYSGKPREAIRAPWDGGFSWKKDANGNDFIATSNQGLGASVWWPCKDHMYDEPENGIVLTINAPNSLKGVGNGRLIKTKKYSKTHTSYVWEVKNPINNYGVNINIGNYTNWTDVYEGEKGKLDLSFWVLKDDLEKAKEQFKDAYLTLEALEYWFGPYPFYEDSYKLVQVPYLGMEHQSSVTYGNQFMKGYLGRDLSGTGVGLNWDFIIIHESGHEWFANNITYKDAADMWIHEGFTSYSESLFIEYHFGQEDAYRYSRGLRSNIENKMPVVGPYDVNQEGSKDMYYKGHNMLHTIRQVVNDTEKWREILRGLNEEYYHATVTTADIENYISEKSGIDFSAVFDQYLRDIRIPVFEYRIVEGGMVYRFANVIDDFEMKVKLKINGVEEWLTANDEFRFFESSNDIESIELNNNFYIIPYDMTVE